MAALVRITRDCALFTSHDHHRKPPHFDHLAPCHELALRSCAAPLLRHRLRCGNAATARRSRRRFSASSRPAPEQRQRHLLLQGDHPPGLSPRSCGSDRRGAAQSTLSPRRAFPRNTSPPQHPQTIRRHPLMPTHRGCARLGSCCQGGAVVPHFTCVVKLALYTGTHEMVQLFNRL